MNKKNKHLSSLRDGMPGVSTTFPGGRLVRSIPVPLM
jgi:hypothetical protein